MTLLHVVYSAAILTAGGVIGSDPRLRSAISRYWRRMLLLALLALAFRMPRDGRFFHGLEYEDAYVYTVQARTMLLGHATIARPYATSVCFLGSLESCQASETYSGHFLGYPYLMWGLGKLVGFWPTIGSTLSIFAGVLGCPLVFIATILITGSALAGTVGAVVFSATPAFAIYGGTASAEPLSSVLVCVLVIIFSSSITRPVAPWYAGVAFGTTLIGAALIKRENLVVGLALAGAALLSRSRDRCTFWRQIVPMAGAALIAVLFGVFGMGLGSVVVAEAAEYGRFPFGLSNLAVLMPVFLRSFVEVQWYGPGAFVVAAGLICACRRRGPNCYPAVVLIALLVLYASHVRSYYQLRGEVSLLDSLRYAVNSAGVWSILAGMGTGALIGRLNQIVDTRRFGVRLAGAAALCATVALCYWQTDSIRARLVEEEYRTRIRPAQQAAVLARAAGAYIVTLEPLLVQIYAPPTTKVFALYELRPELVAELTKGAGTDLLYIEHETYQNTLDAVREPIALSCIRRMRKETIYTDQGYNIFRLTNTR